MTKSSSPSRTAHLVKCQTVPRYISQPLQFPMLGLQLLLRSTGGFKLPIANTVPQSTHEGQAESSQEPNRARL